MATYQPFGEQPPPQQPQQPQPQQPQGTFGGPAAAVPIAGFPQAPGMGQGVGMGVPPNMGMGMGMGMAQQQQQQQQQPFGFGGFGTSDPMMGTAINYVGANMLGSQMANVQSSVHQYMGFLKYYFDVNTQYVLKKLSVVLFPLSHKSWKRARVAGPTGTSYCSPREDVNAPDLYIPLMSFVTYILIVGFVMGTAFKFTPDVLGTAASSGILLLLLEVFILKAGVYLIGSETDIPILDLVSYSGYVFVGVIVNFVVGWVLGDTAYYLSLLATGLMMAVFILRSLRMLVLVDGKVRPEPRTYFLFAIFLLQFVLAWLLGLAADWHPDEAQAVLDTAAAIVTGEDVPIAEE